MPYMQSILDAVDQNQAKARLLIDLEPIKGIENALALGELQAEIDARGLSDRVEIRPFSGPVHAKDALMYRLMKSEKLALGHVVSGSMPSYRQIQINQFRQFSVALTACEAANDKIGPRHYVLNASGEEYCGGSWID